VKLGLDIDAPHEARDVPRTRPSAAAGEQQASSLSITQFTQADFYRSHSPDQLWTELHSNRSLSALDDQQLWNLVAFVWQSSITPADLAEGKKLFAQNCAACHGEGGGGNGVFADQLALAGDAGGMAGTTLMIQRPADFTNTKRMLGASPALLEGKILRGGMGTGMPSWGRIFTEEQIWDIIGYIYSFQFGAVGK
jgi:mono/diheme cytochrome c family protein